VIGWGGGVALISCQFGPTVGVVHPEKSVQRTRASRPLLDDYQRPLRGDGTQVGLTDYYEYVPKTDEDSRGPWSAWSLNGDDIYR
jgi:hypothetical protein